MRNPVLEESRVSFLIVSCHNIAVRQASSARQEQTTVSEKSQRLARTYSLD